MGKQALDERAQVSAELIVVIAALLAVSLVLISQLQNTAKKGGDALEAKTSKAIGALDDIK